MPSGRLGGEVAAEALERLVALLGVLVGDAVGAAHLLERGDQPLARGAGAAQRVAGAARVGAEREQQVLGRDVVVGEPARLAVGGVEHRGELGGDRRRLGGGALERPAAPRATPSSAAADRARVGAELAQQRERDAVGVGEQRREHVRRRDLRVAGALGEADGLGERLLGADCEAIGLHRNLSGIVADLQGLDHQIGSLLGAFALEERVLLEGPALPVGGVELAVAARERPLAPKRRIQLEPDEHARVRRQRAGAGADALDDQVRRRRKGPRLAPRRGEPVVAGDARRAAGGERAGAPR